MARTLHEGVMMPVARPQAARRGTWKRMRQHKMLYLYSGPQSQDTKMAVSKVGVSPFQVGASGSFSAPLRVV